MHPHIETCAYVRAPSLPILHRHLTLCITTRTYTRTHTHSLSPSPPPLSLSLFLSLSLSLSLSLKSVHGYPYSLCYFSQIPIMFESFWQPKEWMDVVLCPLQPLRWYQECLRGHINCCHTWTEVADKAPSHPVTSQPVLDLFLWCLSSSQESC